RTGAARSGWMGSRRSRRVQRVAVSGKEIRYCSMSSLLRLAVAVTHVRRGRGVAHNVVDEAVVHRLLGGEPTVAVGVAVDLLHRLAGLLGGEFCHDLLHVQDEFRVDLDVGRGTADST